MVRITEILANPTGADKNQEWIELCADASTDLSAYALQVGTRRLPLLGSLAEGSCSIARTGTAAIRNREAEIALLHEGGVIQTLRTAGTAPEGAGFHIADTDPFWATSTPGIASGTPPQMPPLPDLSAASPLPGLLGTAACTAGILTALALLALRHARNRHYALQGGDSAPGS